MSPDPDLILSLFLQQKPRTLYMLLILITCKSTEINNKI